VTLKSIMPTTDFKTLAAAAEIIHPRVGGWAYHTWRALNEQLWDGELPLCGIQWGLTPHGRALGYWAGHQNTITLHQSLIEPQGDAWGIAHKLGERYAADVLLHEMIHQYITVILGAENGGRNESPNDSPHNNPYWVGEVNRISRRLGFDCRAEVVKQRRVNGKVKWAPHDGYIDMRELSRFPHPFRPADYYTPD
jgi:hypothetical protein